MIHIAAIHGIDNAPRHRLEYAHQWREALLGHSVTADVEAITWQSQGSWLLDLADMLAGRWWGHAERVADQLDRWIAKTEGRRRIVVAHSGGCPISLLAAPMINERLPLIHIGTPITHPWWGRALDFRLDRPRWADCLAFANRDDAITARGGILRDVADYPYRIAVVGGTSTGMKEHPATAYFEDAAVREAIMGRART